MGSNGCPSRLLRLHFEPLLHANKLLVVAKEVVDATRESLGIGDSEREE